MPQQWYGCKPSLVIDVIRKLETRRRGLRGCIFQAVI
jgi:hypothetical protein